jgi:hypothetical protein
VGLEWGPLSLVSTTEELIGRKSSGSGLENRDRSYGIRHAYHATPFYPQKLALTSATGGSRSVGIVHSRTKTTELLLLLRNLSLIEVMIHTETFTTDVLLSVCGPVYEL